MQKRLHFKTNALLKNLVGKDLINDDTIAVVELVKNAHDAKSNTLLLRFEGFDAQGVTRSDSRLVVRDEGTGMDLDDVKDKWLNIAYSEKKFAPSQPGYRPAGNKGIGRFSCDRLGENLDLLTRVRGGELFHVTIRWPDFEKEGKKDLTIQRIAVLLQTIEPAEAEKLAGIEMPQHGTVLVISKLRSAWDREKLLDLKRALEKFLSPHHPFLTKRFEIRIEAKELGKHEKNEAYVNRVNGVVQNQIFSKLRFNSTFIRARISRDGKTVDTTLSHDGQVVLTLKEKNALGIKNIETFIYYLNPYKKAYFKRQTGMRSIDFGSVFLFLNGFRIAPYGDRGDDWLGLDLRKTQGTTRYLSSRDLVGRVEVFDDEELFKPISSREGLKKTKEFVQLKEEFILGAIRRLEAFVVDCLNWDSIPAHLRSSLRADTGLDWRNTDEEYSESWEKKKQRIALAMMTLIGSSRERIIRLWFNPALLEGVHEQRGEEVRSLLEQIGGFGPSQVEPGLKRTLARLRSIVEKKEQEARVARNEAASLRVAVARKDESISKLAKETETFRAQSLFLQSIGSRDADSLMEFHHEIIQNSNIIDNYVGRATRALRGNEGTADALQAIEKISFANKRILAIAQFATKANFRSAASKEPTDIPAFFEQYMLNVAKDFVATGLSLDVTNSVKEPFEIPARRIELSIVIDNIIGNARKAQARTVRVRISKKSENIVTISFIDDGRGLSASIKDPDDIFQRGITTTSGSGLGLFYSRQIVDALGGSIRAFPSAPGLEMRLEFIR